MSTRKLFFEDLADSLDVWTRTTCDDLFNEDADLLWTHSPEEFRILRACIRQHGLSREIMEVILSELFRGLSDSFLLILDGATKLAEHTRIHVVDGEGESLGEALNEGFMEYLFETGRMK